jgi:ketosteroid isomerase-like protein
MSFKMRTLSLVLVLSAAAVPVSTEEIDATADALTQRLQTKFSEAYNRKDIMTMSELFAEKGWRITPSGLFQGRDAIRRNLQSAIEMGLHDYSVRRTISKFLAQNIIYNAGEWRAKLGDHQYQGFYSALLVRDGDEVKILEETVNVAAP